MNVTDQSVRVAQYFNAADTVLYFDRCGSVVSRSGAGVHDLNMNPIAENESKLDYTAVANEALNTADAELDAVMHELAGVNDDASGKLYLSFYRNIPLWMIVVSLLSCILVPVMERSAGMLCYSCRFVSNWSACWLIHHTAVGVFVGFWAREFPASGAMFVGYASICFLSCFGGIAVGL